jgi:two-component system OmpR family response regulator
MLVGLGTEMPSAHVQESSIGPAHVLVVDDELTLRDLLHDVLVEAGFRVHCADSGRRALKMLDRFRPDVILVDLMMPDMDGWTFARACRSADRASAPGIIVMSAAADAQIAAGVLDVEGWIQKPFDLEQLVELVSLHAHTDQEHAHEKSRLVYTDS